MSGYSDPCKQNCLPDFCRKEVKFIIQMRQELKIEVPVHGNLFVYPVIGKKSQKMTLMISKVLESILVVNQIINMHE